MALAVFFGSLLDEKEKGYYVGKGVNYNRVLFGSLPIPLLTINSVDNTGAENKHHCY
jgi:hypothetical protein